MIVSPIPAFLSELFPTYLIPTYLSGENGGARSCRSLAVHSTPIGILVKQASPAQPVRRLFSHETLFA